MSVFNDFIEELSKLQKQLDVKYNGDGYLRDQILTAVDIPAIQVVLRTDSHERLSTLSIGCQAICRTNPERRAVSRYIRRNTTERIRRQQQKMRSIR